MNFLIFGDQSAETFGALRHLKLSNGPVVRDFITQADIALHRQISLLPQLDKELLPELSLRLESFEDWQDSLTTHPVLRPVLTAAAHFVELLQFVYTHFGLGLTGTNHQVFRYLGSKRDDSDLSIQYMLGSCTGLLSAAAATACTSCTSDWIPLAVQIVCIAFRIGLHTSSVANSLARNDDFHKSWSSIVRGKLDPEILAEYHEKMVCLLAQPMVGYLYKPITADATKECARLTSSIRQCSHSQFDGNFWPLPCLEKFVRFGYVSRDRVFCSSHSCIRSVPCRSPPPGGRH